MVSQNRIKPLTNLLEEIISKEIFNRYELCPYFKDCSKEVTKTCISKYEFCQHYKHRKEIIIRRILK